MENNEPVTVRRGVAPNTDAGNTTYGSKVMKKGNIIARFVYAGTRWTGEIQFALSSNKNDLWYAALDNVLYSNERITILPMAHRDMVEYPISIQVEEHENYNDIINDIYTVFMEHKPEGA